MKVDNWGKRRLSQQRERKEPVRLAENSPRKLEVGPVKTSLTRQQMHLKSNSTCTGFFSNRLFCLGLWMKVIRQTFPGQVGREVGKERQGGGRTGEGLPLAAALHRWVQCAKSGLRHTTGDTGAGSLAGRGLGRALPRKQREVWVVTSVVEHLPSKDLANWHRGRGPECQFSSQ